MKITSEILSNKIQDYLDNVINNNDFAEWAENIMLDGEIADENASEISNTLAEIGLINVSGFELSTNQLLEIQTSLKNFHQQHIKNY